MTESTGTIYRLEGAVTAIASLRGDPDFALDHMGQRDATAANPVR